MLKQLIPKRYQKFKHPANIHHFDFNSLSDVILTKYNGGGVIEELESNWCRFMDVEYSLSFNSGTSALYTIYQSLGLHDGDEVLVSDYTFFACATPLVALGCNVKFIDCDEYGNIDITRLKESISPATKALVITHLWGQPCHMDTIQELCKEFGVYLIEDCSHAHGAIYKGQRVGSFGIASAWSVGAKKNITGGHGGILSTNNKNIFKNAVLLSHYNESRFFSLIDEVPEDVKISGTGFNLRMHQFAASLLLEQIKKIDVVIKQKTQSVSCFYQYIKDLKGISLAIHDKEVQHAFYALPIRINQDILGFGFRDRLLLELNRLGAIDIDKPETTGPLHLYSIFNTHQSNDIFSGALRYHSEVIKLSPWYASERFEYAKWYGEAFQLAYSRAA
ncbi:MAG: aminotransferase class V-fold PLP-dependent enzyme [Enterobacter cloacae]|nr:aminotransferase class V-fold PLP-dependent enzyme [Enterobacter cloacae]